MADLSWKDALTLEGGCGGGDSAKADNIVFNKEDGTLQLTSGGEPIGDAVIIKTQSESVGVTDAAVNADGDLVLTFSDGTIKNLGCVVGDNGSVYVPHVDEHKVLTFTIEDKPAGTPDPVDLNPSDDWGDIEDPDIVRTDYEWEDL